MRCTWFAQLTITSGKKIYTYFSVFSLFFQMHFRLDFKYRNNAEEEERNGGLFVCTTVFAVKWAAVKLCMCVVVVRWAKRRVFRAFRFSSSSWDVKWSQLSIADGGGWVALFLFSCCCSEKVPCDHHQQCLIGSINCNYNNCASACTASPVPHRIAHTRPQ